MTAISQAMSSDVFSRMKVLCLDFLKYLGGPGGRAGPGGRVTRLLVTFLGSQLDKPRLFLVATNRVHVNIAVIINAIVLYILVFMYLLEIKLQLLLFQLKITQHWFR